VDSDVPVLLLAGQFDSTTPPSYAAQVAESLSQSKTVEFPGQGHGVTFSNVSNCPRDVLFSFLREPEESIDTSCVDSMEEVSFSTPYTGQPPLELTALRDSQDGIVTKIPTHWEKRGEGFYIRNLSGWDMTRLEFLQTRASVDTWLSWLMENYASEGLDSYPLKTSDVEANGMVWKLYESTFRGYPVDLALAQNEFQTILVAMLSHVDEHEALYQTVFLEVIKETTSLR